MFSRSMRNVSHLFYFAHCYYLNNNQLARFNGIRMSSDISFLGLKLMVVIMFVDVFCLMLFVYSYL